MNSIKEHILLYYLLVCYYVLLTADRIGIQLGRMIGRKYHKNGKDWYVRIK